MSEPFDQRESAWRLSQAGSPIRDAGRTLDTGRPSLTGTLTGTLTGWICPRCDTSNAPTNQTCFACAMREGARS